MGRPIMSEPASFLKIPGYVHVPITTDGTVSQDSLVSGQLAEIII